MGEALIQRKKNAGQKRERRGIWAPKQKEWEKGMEALIWRVCDVCPDLAICMLLLEV